MFPKTLEKFPISSCIEMAPVLSNEIDPFLFSHRVALYKQLIISTNRDNKFNSDNSLNPLWGLLFQLHWQYRTNRLGADSSTNNDVIHPDAPWGYGNFLLSIIPLIGAMDSNIIKNINILPPIENTHYKYIWHDEKNKLIIPIEYENARQEWKNYFLATQTIKTEEDHEILRKALWKAHKSCIDTFKQNAYLSETTYYTQNEIHFLEGWCRTMDYLWIAAWPTDYNFMSVNGVEVLPERLLSDEDDNRQFRDFTNKIRRNVKNILNLADSREQTHKLKLWLWKRIMRTSEARHKVATLLEAMFDPSPTSYDARKELWIYFISMNNSIK